MGGCRCTYRNCTVKSDQGQTHLFHYPVFDKVRCHQWLTKAHRLDFLNLKVSQLKNRVVCQHHFKDDLFMNVLKEKLKPYAIPTEDGPYCVSNNDEIQSNVEIMDQIRQHIDQEYVDDRKANFSVKYGEFLTNCDVIDYCSLQDIENPKQKKIDTSKISTQKEKRAKRFQRNVDVPKAKHYILAENNDITTENLVVRNQDTAELQKKHSNVQIISEEKVKMSTPDFQSTVLPPPSSVNPSYFVLYPKKGNSKIHQPQSMLFNEDLNKTENQPQFVDNASIEVSLHENVKLHPVLQSVDIKAEKFQMKQDTKSIQTERVGQQHDSTQNVPSYCVTPSVNKKQDDEIRTTQNVLIDVNKSKNYIEVEIAPDPKPPISVNLGNQEKIITVNQTEKKPVRNKIAQERVAFIEEKRKFNRKLRDIISDKLNILECEDDVPLKRKKGKTLNVSSHLGDDPQLPDSKQYAVAYLEAKMKNMESLLINRIDHNTKKITEIKTLITDNKTIATTCTCKCSATKEFELDDHSQKKKLFKQLSQYLSAEARSLVFEELFLNIYDKDPKKAKSPQIGKRKRKRL